MELVNKIKNYKIHPVIPIIVVVLVVYLLFKLGKAAVAKIDETKEDNRISDKEYEYARRFFNAGIGLGTDEDAMFDIAKEINEKQYVKVGKAFRDLYSESLADFITSELDTVDEKKFYELLRKAK